MQSSAFSEFSAFSYCRLPHFWPKHPLRPTWPATGGKWGLKLEIAKNGWRNGRWPFFGRAENGRKNGRANGRTARKWPNFSYPASCPATFAAISGPPRKWPPAILPAIFRPFPLSGPLPTCSWSTGLQSIRTEMTTIQIPDRFKNVIVTVIFAKWIPLGIPRCNCNEGVFPRNCYISRVSIWLGIKKCNCNCNLQQINSRKHK